MTSVGYGTYAPETKEGRVFAFIYAWLTLPIFAYALT